MWKTLIAALFVCALSAPFAAQTVEFSVDLSALGWGPLSIPQKINTDGDADTREYLVRSLRTNQYRVLAVRPEQPGGLCVGDWFSAADHWMAVVEVQTAGAYSTLMVRDRFGKDTEIRLDTPICR